MKITEASAVVNSALNQDGRWKNKRHIYVTRFREGQLARLLTDVPMQEKEVALITIEFVKRFDGVDFCKSIHRMTDKGIWFSDNDERSNDIPWRPTYVRWDQIAVIVLYWAS